MRDVLMGFVGDVLVDREHPLEVFSEIREVLRAPQILFANLEGAYTDHPQPPPGILAAVYPAARHLDVYPQAGFNVVSMANNHILDAGYEAMLETRARLNAQGVRTCGAGENLSAARAPAIAQAGDLRVAFLAYASMFPVGYEARATTPGLAPMRAYNFWRELSPGVHRPGTLPLVTTVPDATDTANLAEDIVNARQHADLVVTSFHWGDYRRPFHLTDHEKRTARFCIDQGADLVVGHHHHALRGMEWYRGKPILYGLAHFVFDLHMEFSEEVKNLRQQRSADELAYEVGPREGWPLLPLHEDTRMTVMACATANRAGINEIGFLPCRLTADGRVHPLRLGSPESDEVVRYVQKCNQSQGLNGRIVTDDPIPLADFSALRVSPV